MADILVGGRTNYVRGGKSRIIIVAAVLLPRGSRRIPSKNEDAVERMDAEVELFLPGC